MKLQNLLIFILKRLILPLVMLVVTIIMNMTWPFNRRKSRTGRARYHASGVCPHYRECSGLWTGY